MSKTRAIALSFYLNRSSALFAGLIAFGAFMYGVLLLLTVMHAASQHTAQSQIHDLSVHVAELESQYLTQTQAITPATVAQLGYVEPIKVSTVYTGGASGELSLRSVQ